MLAVVCGAMQPNHININLGLASPPFIISLCRASFRKRCRGGGGGGGKSMGENVMGGRM